MNKKITETEEERLKMEIEEGRLKDKILKSQIDWWNGLMVFSGLCITFLSIQKTKCFSNLLIFLYFIIAGLCILLIYETRSVYNFIQENYSLWISKDISEEQKEKDVQWSIKKNKIVKTIEKILNWIILVTIILTLINFLVIFK